MALSRGEVPDRNSKFIELIEAFKKESGNKFANLNFQDHQIVTNIYFLIELNGYPMSHMHYEIFARGWDVYLGLHFENAETRDLFRAQFQINDDRFWWDTNYNVNRKISHKTFFQLTGTSCESMAKDLVKMLQDMEVSLGERVRELATKILNS